MAASRDHSKVAMLITTIAIIISSVVARLMPTVVGPQRFDHLSKVLNVCRTTVRDVDPFLLIVFIFADDVPDAFLRHTHETVDTAILLIDVKPSAAETVDFDRLMDIRVALMVIDRPDTVAALIDDVPSAWDPMSHYVWLMPQIDRSTARTLFQTVWRQRSIVNVVIVTPYTAYTYNPFRDVLKEHQTVDGDELRTVARQKMTNLNGHPVRICMFPTRLNAVKQPDGSYKGTDGIVISTLAKQMNFTPIYTEPSDGMKYGWAELNSDSNFTYTGLLGDLVHNKVDMAFNGVFLNAYNSNNTIRYTAPVMFDELCFVVAKARQMSQWRAVFTAFDIRLWYILAVSFAIALGAWALIKRRIGEPYTLTALAINLFRMFLMVPLNRVPNNIPERLMVVSTVLFGFIMATSLQAVMVKYLNYPKYERNVATVRELYNTGMLVMLASTNIILLFETDDDPLYIKMSDRFLFIKNKSVDILGEVADKRSSAAIGRKNDLVEKIARSYVKNNEVLLHIVDDCPRSFHIVYLVRRDVPFMNVINRIITAFVESGIVNSWFMHAKPFQPISDYHHGKEQHKVFTMKNVVIAFLCLMIGLTISGIAFSAELVYYYKFDRPKIVTTTRNLLRPI